MKLNMHDVWLSRRKDFGIQRFWQVTGAARVFGGSQAFTSGARRNSVTLRLRPGAMLIFGSEYWHTWFLWNKMSTISLGRDGCLIFSGVHLHLQPSVKPVGIWFPESVMEVATGLYVDQCWQCTCWGYTWMEGKKLISWWWWKTWADQRSISWGYQMLSWWCPQKT